MSIPAQFDIYSDVWQEDHNRSKLMHGISRALREKRSVVINLQPGDGTKYTFLLAPEPQGFDISSDGREYQAPYYGDTLVATRIDHHWDETSVLCFHKSQGIESIRSVIKYNKSFENLCTVEALAQTIYHIWGEGAMT